ncbi:hypothetical protein H0H93_010090 [Arthromyces matolae]|nr:hypothetical protein H0H93_010090 [Arthromyces matolae]
MFLLRQRTTLSSFRRGVSFIRLGSSKATERFIPSRLSEIEDVEGYQYGGFHPLAIGDTLAHGRYRIIHKLGFGGSSTIWLARNNKHGTLVTLKVLRADMSYKPIDKIPEMAVPKRLLEIAEGSGHFARNNIQTIDDHFIETGPNGSHLCLVTKFAGPSISAMSDSPGRVWGSKRLRSHLARKVAKQVVQTVQFMHNAGFVHGDLTTSNILFLIKENFMNMPDSDVYAHFCEPETEEVRTRDDSPIGPHAPEELVAPIENSLLTHSLYLQEEVMLIDFGQAFYGVRPPKSYKPATLPSYQPPESHFEGKINMSSDIWALGCTIFQIRAGSPLFETFFEAEDEVLKQIVSTLGKPPESWWDSYKDRHPWFDEDGNPKPQELQRGFVPVEKTSIKQKLSEIGSQDVPSEGGTDGSMFEPPGARMDEVEINLLGDLLEKMVRYRPEDRININEVASHPWFSL